MAIGRFLLTGAFMEALFRGLQPQCVVRGRPSPGRFTFSPHGFLLKGGGETSVVNPTGFEIKILQTSRTHFEPETSDFPSRCGHPTNPHTATRCTRVEPDPSLFLR